MKTIAQTIADFFVHGQCSEKDGRSISVACAEECVDRDEEGTSSRYEFQDESTIIVSSGGWDLGFTGLDCFCWEGAGHHSDCEHS